MSGRHCHAGLAITSGTKAQNTPPADQSANVAADRSREGHGHGIAGIERTQRPEATNGDAKQRPGEHQHDEVRRRCDQHQRSQHDVRQPHQHVATI